MSVGFGRGIDIEVTRHYHRAVAGYRLEPPEDEVYAIDLCLSAYVVKVCVEQAQAVTGLGVTQPHPRRYPCASAVPADEPGTVGIL